MDSNYSVANRTRFTNYRTGEYYETGVNPQPIKDSCGSNLVEYPVPGLSDPIIDWISGKAKTIHLTIELDAEIEARRLGFSRGDSGNYEYDLTSDIAWFESFCFPVDPTECSWKKEPDKLIFTMGSRYNGILCLLESVDIEITEFSPKHAPTKAKLGLSLKRRIDVQRFSNSIISSR